MTPSYAGRSRYFDPSMSIPLGPSSPFSMITCPPPCPPIFEYSLSRISSDYAEKVDRIEKLSISQAPKSYSGRYESSVSLYPAITFEPRQIRQYLSEKLAAYRIVDIWIGGSSVHPSELAYNDIDYKIYVAGGANLLSPTTVDQLLYKFVEEQIKQTGCSATLHPLIIHDLYYTDRALFKNKSGEVIGAQYGIGDVGFTLFYNTHTHYHSLSPADGVQCHPVRQVCRFSLGQRFAVNEGEALYALNCAKHRHYDIVSIAESRDAIFRIAFKMTQEHRVNAITIKEAIHKWKQEYTSPPERAKKFGKHQLIHYPHQAGRVVDFLNFLSLFSEEADYRTLAQDWIQINADFEIGKKLKFGHEQEFAKLIIRDPSVVPHILSIFRGVILLAWANQKEGQKHLISAYEFGFRKDATDVRYAFAISMDKHTYHLKLPETLPTQIAASYLEGIIALQSKFNASFPTVIETLKHAVICLGIDPSYLISDTFVLTKHLTNAFDTRLAKQFLLSSFKHGLKEIYEVLARITSDPQEQLAFVRKSIIANLRYRNETMSRIDPSFQKCFKLICDYSEYTDYPSSITVESDLQSLNELLSSLCKNSLFQTAGFTDLLKAALPKLLPLIIEKLFVQTPSSEMLKQIKALCHLSLGFEIMARQENQEIVAKIERIESSLLSEKLSEMEEKKESKEDTLSKSDSKSNVVSMTTAPSSKPHFDTSSHFTATKETADQLVSKLNDTASLTVRDHQFIHTSCQYVILSLKKGKQRLDRLSQTQREALGTSIQHTILGLTCTFAVEPIRLAQAIFNQSEQVNLLDSTALNRISFALIRAYAHLAIACPEMNNFTNIKKLVTQLTFTSTDDYSILCTLLKQMLKQDLVQQAFAVESLLKILKNDSLEDACYQQLIPIVYLCIHSCLEKSEDDYKDALSIFMTFSKHIRPIADRFSDNIHRMLLEIFCQDKYHIREEHVEIVDRILITLRSKNYFTNLTSSYPIIEAIQKTNIRKLCFYIPFYFFGGLDLKDPKFFLALADYLLWFNRRSDESPKLDPSSYELLKLYIPQALEICREPAAQKIISDCAIKIYAKSGDEYALAKAYEFFARIGYEPDYRDMCLYLLKTISLYSLHQASTLLINSIANIVKQVMIYDTHAYEDLGASKVIQEYLQQFFTQLTASHTEREMTFAYRLLEEYVCMYKDRINDDSLVYVFSLLYLPKLCLLDEPFHTRYNHFKTILTPKQLKITNSAVGNAQIEHFSAFSTELETIKNSITTHDITIRKKRLQAMGLEIIKMISSYKAYCSNDDLKEKLMYKFLNTYAQVFNRHSLLDIQYFTTFIDQVIREEVFKGNLYSFYSDTINKVYEELNPFLMQCMDLILHSSVPEATQILMNCLKQLYKTKNPEPSFFASLGKYHQMLASNKVLLLCVKGKEELQDYFDFIQDMFRNFKDENNLLAIESHLSGLTYVIHRLHVYPIFFRHLVETLNKKLLKPKKSQLNPIQHLLKSVDKTATIDVEKILKDYSVIDMPNLSILMSAIDLKIIGEEIVRGIFFCKNQSKFEYLLGTQSFFYTLDFGRHFSNLQENYSKFLAANRKPCIHSEKAIPAISTTTSLTPAVVVSYEAKTEIDADDPSDANLDDLLTSVSNAIEQGFAESDATSTSSSSSVSSSKKKKKKKKKGKPGSRAGVVKAGIKSDEEHKSADSDSKECKTTFIISK